MAASRCHVTEDAAGRLHLIDTGTESPDNWQALRHSLASEGRRIEDVATVTLTHLHRDHAGLTARIQEASGAVVRMHRDDAECLRERRTYLPADRVDSTLRRWGVPEAQWPALRLVAARQITDVPDFTIDEELVGGEVVNAPGISRLILHTPGHTAGHVVVVDDAQRALYTGDHVLPGVNPGVGLGSRTPGDDPVGDHLRSLALLDAYESYEVHPGHGRAFLGVRLRSLAIRDRHISRGDAVRAAAESRPGVTVWDAAQAAPWTRGFAGLAGVALFSALAQTEMHLARAICAGETL